MSSPPPKAEGYWTKPTPAQRGDANADAIYLAVGKALSGWEMIEDAVARMFGAFLEGPSSLAAERVFGTIVSNFGKRTALSAATEVIFDTKRVAKEHREMWQVLVDHYGAGGTRRLEIAHGVVVGVSYGSDYVGHFLMPPHYNTKKTDLPWVALLTKEGLDSLGQEYRFTSQDIDHFTTRFGELQRWLMEYYTVYFQNYPPTSWTIVRQ